MAYMTTVNWGTVAATPGFVNIKSACIIGKATSSPTTNPTLITNIGEMPAGISTSDPLYKAAQDFFAGANGNSLQLLVYALGDSGDTISGTEMVGLKNGVNNTFYFTYSPITAIANVAFNHDNSGWVSETEATNYTTGTDKQSIEGVYVASGITGFYWSGTDGITAIVPTIADALQADLTIPALGSAFADLTLPGNPFYFFTFAYDQSAPQHLTGVWEGDKFDSGNCLNGKSWLNDVYMGKAMADQFNTIGKHTQFLFALPDYVKPQTILYSGFASGTEYDDNSKKFGEIRNLIGNDKYVSCFSAKLDAAPAGNDMAAFSMGDICAQDSPRKSIFGMAMNLAQSAFPQSDEIMTWKRVQVNPVDQVYYTDGTSVIILAGGKTFGLGVEGDINYIHCKNIFTDSMADALKTLILRREIHYDVAGMSKIEQVILGVEEMAMKNRWIDDLGTVTIPIKDYLLREGTLNAGQQLVLDNARGSKVVSNITVTYKWNGDVETIIINALVSE